MTLEQTVLAEIDGGKITAAEMLASMRSRADLSALSGAVEDRIVRSAAERAGLKVSGAELQKAADAERQRLGLFRAADTQEWLKRQGLSVDDFERGVELVVLREKLREQMTAKGIQTHFDANKADYAVALISAITVTDKNLASELASQIADEGADFVALAAKHNPDDEARARCGALGYVTRAELPPDAARAVFAAKAGAVVGPVMLGKAHALLKVWSIKPATLDDATRAAISEDLFQDWLAKLVDKAKLHLP